MPVANFIATYNNIEESHIGYCGKEIEEIVHSLRHDYIDVPFEDSFIIAFNDEGEMLGVVGFDVDLESKTAEIWGPFIHSSYEHILNEVWEKLMNNLPAEVNVIHLFPNMKNTIVINLANQLSFEKKSSQTILCCNKDNFVKSSDRAKFELNLEDITGFIALHDQIFPNTYYSGRDIIDRLSEVNKIFISKDSELKGYVYVEAQPEFGEASIEFIAVAKAFQGQGIGLQLLEDALEWLFEFSTIEVISLCVDSNNPGAIALYKKAGFTQQHQLEFYSKQID
ncbi:GNAT family N-acetyltransferase [Cytobacillus suaedae]|nr:GNAT family N-acetyltransferase [Cytobacillus suaedae]